MPLTRKAKIWLILLSIPVVLFIAAVVALKIYFTSDRLKALIIPRLEEATGRPVTISSISLSVFPTQAVEIDSLSIANQRGTDFSSKPMFSLDRLEIDVRIFALLRDALEINKLELLKPKVFLEISKDGVANYANPQKPTSTADTGKTASDLGRVVLSDFEIEDGTIEYVDRKKNMSVTINGLNEKLNMEMKPVVHEARIEARTTIDRLAYGTTTEPVISNLRISMNQKVLYEMDRDLLTIQKADAKIQDIDLGIQGTVAGLTKMPAVDITIESDKINIADLLSLVPKEYLKKAEGLKGDGFAHIRIAIKGTAADSLAPDITGSISVVNGSIQYAGLPKSITNVNLVADFVKGNKRQEAHVTDFSASLGDNTVGATMTLVNFDDPSITMALRASANLSDVRDFYPLDSGTTLAGALKGSVTVEGKVRPSGGKAEAGGIPTSIKATGSLDFQDVTIKTAKTKNPLQNLRGTVALNNETIESKELSMTIGKSDLSLSFWVKNYLAVMAEGKSGPTPTANLVLNSKHMYTSDVMSGGGGLVLPNVDMDISTTIGTLSMEKLNLTNVRGSMKIAKSIITMQTFSFNVFEGTFGMKGTMNLQKPERTPFDLAMDLNSVNAHTMMPMVTSFGQRMYGKLGMNTTIKGALDDTLGLIPQTLNGQGKVQLQNGKLTGVKVNKSIAGLLKLPNLEEINFKDWSNTFTIADGRLVIKDLRITALDADYVINGSQGLDGSLDYTMSLILPEKTSSKITIPGFAGQAVSLFKDESGKVKLDFAVGGTADNPQVVLDTKAAQKKAEDLAKQKVAEEAKKLEQQVKKQGENALKKLFKKK